MPISLECECGRKFRVKDEASGKKVRCPDCQKVQLVSAAEDVSFEEPEALESSIERRPANRAKKARLKSRGGMPIKTLIGIVVGVCVLMASSYFGYQFLRGNQQAKASPAASVASSIQSTKTHYQKIQFPLPPVDPSKYGGPAPGNLIISPLLVLEMELMEIHRSITESGRKFNENDPNWIELMPVMASEAKSTIQRLITRLRTSDPKLFCHTEAHEALLASGDESTVRSGIEEYIRLYPRAKRDLLELPGVVESSHSLVESGQATIGRVEAMIHTINGEDDIATKFIRSRHQPQKQE